MYTDLVRAGIKPENIIFMAYTSILDHRYNPYPGKIFTDPSETTDGDWAQYGCFNHVDYTNKHINGKVFLGIISGDKEGVAKLTGKEDPKVLAAGPEDTVFTYFIDHGSNGIIGVGDDYVHAKDFIAALETAHEKKLYGKWVWYMEACHSGSMFRDLPSDWNIYVMTSADATHDADMAFCPPHDTVAGKSLGVCLAGLWDNSFLDYVEKHPKATIGEIFDVVHEDVAKTSVQNVSEWGDKTFRELPWGEVYIQPFTGRVLTRAAFTFGTRIAAFRAAAEKLGGIPLRHGDAGYEFTLFDNYRLRLLVWEGDDEFPPNAQILFYVKLCAVFPC